MSNAGYRKITFSIATPPLMTCHQFVDYLILTDKKVSALEIGFIEKGTRQVDLREIKLPQIVAL